MHTEVEFRRDSAAAMVVSLVRVGGLCRTPSQCQLKLENLAWSTRIGQHGSGCLVIDGVETGHRTAGREAKRNSRAATYRDDALVLPLADWRENLQWKGFLCQSAETSVSVALVFDALAKGAVCRYVLEIKIFVL